MRISQDQKQLVAKLGSNGVEAAELSAQELREAASLIEAGAAFFWWKGLIVGRYTAAAQGLQAAQAAE